MKKEEYDVFDVACPICGKSTMGVLLKPETFFRAVCPECHTPIYVYVTSNLDIYTFGEDEICPTCYGSGKCPDCMGTGKVTCPKCNGQGWYKQGSYYYTCEMCGGDGSLGRSLKELKGAVNEGKYEVGSGKVECSKCKGTGICPTCHGMRFVPKAGKK